MEEERVANEAAVVAAAAANNDASTFNASTTNHASNTIGTSLATNTANTATPSFAVNDARVHQILFASNLGHFVNAFQKLLSFLLQGLPWSLSSGRSTFRNWCIICMMHLNFPLQQYQEIIYSFH